MIATCTGYDTEGRKTEFGIDYFEHYTVTFEVTREEMEPDIVLFGNRFTEDVMFNCITFTKQNGDERVLLTSGTVYLMNDTGKTFQIIRGNK